MDIQVVINQMIQLFMVIGLGYLLMKTHVLDEVFNKKLNTLLLTVTTPALILSSVMGNDTMQDANTVLFVFVVAIIVYVLLPLLGIIITKLLRVPHQQAGLYIFMTVFSNIGFMGFPVMKAIFGNGAVFYTAIFNMIFNIFVYTVGIYLINLGSGAKTSFQLKNLRSPGIIACLIALFIYFLHIQTPSIIAETCDMVGSITTPIAMLLIGATLANIDVKSIFSEFRLYPYTIIKQILIPVIAFPILKLFIQDSYILGITLIMLAMPVANSAVLFSQEYGGDVELAAKSVFITTLISVVTIPAIVSFLLI